MPSVKFTREVEDLRLAREAWARCTRAVALGPDRLEEAAAIVLEAYESVRHCGPSPYRELCEILAKLLNPGRDL